MKAEYIVKNECIKYAFVSGFLLSAEEDSSFHHHLCRTKKKKNE